MPIQILEALRSYAELLQANPIAILSIALIGGACGFWLKSIVHRGKVEALEERVKLKQEQLELKDKAIESLSSKQPVVERAAAAIEKEAPLQPNSNRARPTTAREKAFAATNASIIAETEAQLRALVLGEQFRFVFNPSTGSSKLMTFLSSGAIGQGNNSNEHGWRIKDGRLEILEDNGAVHSRFVLLPDGRTLHHTNDPDTQSLKGQYLMPESKLKRDARTGQFKQP